jgi:hypothetical protein
VDPLPAGSRAMASPTSGPGTPTPSPASSPLSTASPGSNGSGAAVPAGGQPGGQAADLPMTATSSPGDSSRVVALAYIGIAVVVGLGLGLMRMRVRGSRSPARTDAKGRRRA